MLDIIAPQEEARLAVLGCHKLLEPGDGPALIFDIGGGSTELVLVDQDEGVPRIRRLVERALGRRLADRKRRPGGARGPGPRPGLRADARAGAAQLRPLCSTCCRATREGIRLLGTSGTVTTLASVHLALPTYDRRAVDGLHVPSTRCADQHDDRREWTMTSARRLPCIGPDRADLVVAGCAILEAILDIWPAEKLGVADRGIREGILRSLMARDGYVL